MTTTERLVDILQATGGWTSDAELAVTLGRPLWAVELALNKLVRANRVRERTNPGGWREYAMPVYADAGPTICNACGCHEHDGACHRLEV